MSIDLICFLITVQINKYTVIVTGAKCQTYWTLRVVSETSPGRAMYV